MLLLGAPSPFYIVQYPIQGMVPVTEGSGYLSWYNQGNPPQVCSEACDHVILGSCQVDS